MKFHINKLRFLTPVFVLLFVFNCTRQNNKTLRIAVASNFVPTLQELLPSFEQKCGIKVQIISASSAQLYAQIEQGAPFDIFLSANQDFPKKLSEKGLTQKPQTYAYGKLILISQSAFEYDDFVNDKQGKIAIANPKFAPYGMAAKEYLEKSNLFESKKINFVYAENVAQSHAFVLSGAAKFGVSSLALINSIDESKKLNYIELDSLLYKPIQQDLCVISNSQNKEEIECFLEFLYSSESQNILINKGYKIPKLFL